MRLYWSPIVGMGTIDDPYRASMEDKAGVRKTSSVIPGTATGKPRYAHALVLVAADDWTGVEADSEQVLLGEFASGKRFIERVAGVTVGNLSSARRTAWAIVLDGMGAVTSDITAATPLSTSLDRLLYQMDPLLKAEGMNV